MRKRLLKWTGAITLALLAIALIAPQSRYGLIGYLCDERFEDGYPAGYWIVALRDRNPDVREQATICLARIGPAAPQAAPALIQALDDDVPLIRAKAAFALLKTGVRDKSAVPKLIVLLKDELPLTRLDASMVLNQMGPEAREAVPALVEAIRDQANAIRLYASPVNTRQHAAAALGSIGPEAKSAAPILIQALRDEDRILREIAARSLGRMHCAEAVPALVEAVRADQGLGYWGAISLGEIGPEARSAVPILRELLRAPNPPTRTEAANALRKIDPEAAAKAGLP